MFTLILSNPFCYQCIFPNSKLVQAKQQFRDDWANSLVLHLPTCVNRTSGSTIKLEWKIDTRLSCIHICGKRCTALAHPKALLAPCIHPSITNPHVNCTSSCKCSCCRIYPTEFMGKCICFCWAIGNWSKLNYQMFNLCSYCKVDGLRAWIKIELRFPSPPRVPKSQSWKHHQNYETRFCVQMWRAEET